MRVCCRIFQVTITAVLLCVPVLAYAQAPTTAAPSTSTPGKSSVKVDMVPSLFVMNARGAILQGQTLTLAGISHRWRSAAGGPHRTAADPYTTRQ